MCGEDSNPYDSLNLNFEKKIIQKEINLYQAKNRKSRQESHHVEHFTYDSKKNPLNISDIMKKIEQDTSSEDSTTFQTANLENDH